MGGARAHIKAQGLSLVPHQRKLCTEGLLGQHALGMLGRTMIIYDTHSLAGPQQMCYSGLGGGGAYLGEVGPHTFNFISQCVIEARDQRLKLSQLLHRRRKGGRDGHIIDMN